MLAMNADSGTASETTVALKFSEDDCMSNSCPN